MKTAHFFCMALLMAASLACNSSKSPTEPPAEGSTAVAVVGCSQTTNAWRGWNALGDSRAWTVIQGYGGGDIVEWATTIPNGFYWARLDNNGAANAPATAVWWQICDLDRDMGKRADADAVLAEIKRRLPGATVYVSPLADFQRPETCVKQAIENSRALADHVVATGGGLRGPDLPMVLDQWIQPPEGDGACHVGPTGSEAFGVALAAFNWGG